MFKLGQLLATPGALEAINEASDSAANFFVATLPAIGATWTAKIGN